MSHIHQDQDPCNNMGPNDKDDKILEKELNIKYPVWRCNVCGYLCARENPPEICPICKAKKERFEIFINN